MPPSGIHLDLAVNSQGEILIADGDKHRISKIDPLSGNIEAFQIDLKYMDKPFTPYGIFPDTADNIYIANPDLHTVLMIDPDGSIKKKTGGFGSILERPVDIVMDTDGNMYVLDAIGPRIHVFSHDGTTTESIQIETKLQNSSVTYLCIDPNGNIFIPDKGARKILKISPTRKTIMFGEISHGEGYPIDPTGIAFGENDTIFVTDYFNNALYQFDSEGRLIKDHVLIRRYLSNPSAVTFHNGFLYIVNEGKSKILQFELKHAVTGKEHGLLGEMFVGEELYQEAIYELKAALELGDNSGDVYYFLGLSFYHTDNFQESFQYFTSALKENPKDVDAIFQLGNAYYKIKNLSKAIENYERVLNLKPHHSTALHNLAEVYLETGDLEKAESLFLNAVRASPDSIDAKIGLGRVFLEKCENENAEKGFSEILQKTPEVRQARYFLGLAFFNQRKYEKAIDTLSRVSIEGPYYLDALYYLGLSYKSIGEYQRSKESFEKIIRIKPDHQGAREQLRK